MPVFFKSDKFLSVLLTVFFFCLLPFFYMHQSVLTIDTGREFYMAERLLHDEVLYKDIFNIYGALPYMVNSFLFMIFGIKLKTLYIAGTAVSWITVMLIYFISREFLNKKLSFLIGLTTMTSLVFGVLSYNTIMPYAYAITYALAGFLASVFLLIRYIKSENKALAYGACIAAGFSFACKYEFLPYIFVMAYALKGAGIKTGVRCFCYTLFLPALSFSLLLLKGLSISDIKTTAMLLNKMVHAPSMTIFYKSLGIYPDIKSIINLAVHNEIFATFAFLPIINAVLFLKNIKNTVKNKSLFIFLLCSFSACFKCFFYMNVNHYGIYVFPICLIAFAVLSEKFLKQLLTLILIASVFLFGTYNFNILKDKTYPLKSAKGEIYTFVKDGKPIKTAVDYIERNSREDDTVLVIPEGAIINFLSGRKSMNMYHSLIPLYYEDVFGEEKIVSDFLKNEPEIVVILNQNTGEYGKIRFGEDYGNALAEIIIRDYEAKYTDNFVNIFKKK